MSKHTAILDIGSSKVLCIICSPDEKGEIIVHGAGVCGYKGYRHGAFLDERKLKNTIIETIEKAEDDARRHVKDIAVGVSAPFSKLVLRKGEARVESRKGLITQRDIDAMIDSSFDYGSVEGYALMHSTPVEFELEGIPCLDMPLGMPAEYVRGLVSHVYVSIAYKRLVADALSKLGLVAETYISVPMAEGLFMIPDQYSQTGALLVDVGYTHTDVINIRNSVLVGVKTLEVGGMHFTNDLAYGFNIPMSASEGLKRRYVYSLDYKDSIESIRIPEKGVFRAEYSAIQDIIEARTDELIELIAEAADELEAPLDGSRLTYLTGGGIALMRGSCEYLEQRLNTPVSINMPWMPRLSSPNYASAFSVMNFVMSERDIDVPQGKSVAGNRGFFNKLRGIFKE